MLANLEVREWKEMRKVLSPGFSPFKLKSMVPQVSSLIQVFLQNVERMAGSSVDFYPLFQGLTLDIIGRTGFGVESDIQTNLNDPLHLAVQEEFAKSPSSRLVQFCLAFPEFSFILQPLRLLWHKISTKSRSSSALWDLGKRIVEERLNSPPRPDLLQLLIQSHFASSDSLKVVANAVLFFEAAYETMSSCCGFLVHFVVNHQEVQERLRKEIEDCMEEDTSGNNPSTILNSYEFIQKLDLMTAVMKETLRILPPQTTFISRYNEIS
jgi:cytochrome P450 family 6